MADRPSATTVVGEDKAPITTLAIGEEHVITTLVGEQAQPHPDYASAAASDNEAVQGSSNASTIVGEAWNPVTTVAGEGGGANANAAAGAGPTTTVVGEEGPHISTLLGGEETVFTTTAIGEEGHGQWTTTLLGEGGGGQQTTTLLGEEGGGRPPVTTLAIGEEGPSTTTIVGEGGPFGNY